MVNKGKQYRDRSLAKSPQNPSVPIVFKERASHCNMANSCHFGQLTLCLQDSHDRQNKKPDALGIASGLLQYLTRDLAGPRLEAIKDLVVPETVKALQQFVHLRELVCADASNLLNGTNMALIQLCNRFSDVLAFFCQADAD